MPESAAHLPCDSRGLLELRETARHAATGSERAAEVQARDDPPGIDGSIGGQVIGVHRDRDLWTAGSLFLLQIAASLEAGLRGACEGRGILSEGTKAGDEDIGDFDSDEEEVEEGNTDQDLEGSLPRERPEKVQLVEFLELRSLHLAGSFLERERGRERGREGEEGTRVSELADQSLLLRGGD